MESTAWSFYARVSYDGDPGSKPKIDHIGGYANFYTITVGGFIVERYTARTVQELHDKLSKLKDGSVRPKTHFDDVIKEAAIKNLPPYSTLTKKLREKGFYEISTQKYDRVIIQQVCLSYDEISKQ